MIDMQFAQAQPVDRDVEVTVTLTFPESVLRQHRREHSLGDFLSRQFASAIDGGHGDNYAYTPADKLLGTRP